MSKLMVSVSGIRGIVGDTLKPATIEKYVSAFAALVRSDADKEGAKIILGADSRISGPWVVRMVESLLMAFGFTVVNIGVVPTPTVQFIVQQYEAAAGIVVTSSHNPIEWNGLKFVHSDGLFFTKERNEAMWKLVEDGFDYPSFEVLGSVEYDNTAAQQHIDFLKGLEYINVEQVAARKFKVVLDTVNGAGGPIMKQLLEEFGCEVVALNNEPTGRFSHKPEPIPEHLGQLCEAVVEHQADLGVATDPDVDRCVLIDETGKPLGEEYTLSLAVEFMLGHVGKRGPVCKNLSTTRAVDDIAAKYDCEVVATAVGEINVAAKMVEIGSVIGGEGNGGVMLPDCHIGRDAPVAAVLTLQHLALFDGTLSQLKASLPQYEIAKLKCPLGDMDADAVIDSFKTKWQGKAKIDETDGVRIDADFGWVHLRKSNTEPIVRVIGESGTEETSLEMCERFMAELLANA